MIRDVTKSVISFSWAMSLFGVKQLTNLASPQSPAQTAHKAAVAFDAVTATTENQLGDVLKGAFQAGDQLQKGMVDLTLGIFSLEALNPSQMMQMTSNVMTQAMGAVGQGIPRGQSGPSQSTDTGWGPVRPPQNP